MAKFTLCIVTLVILLAAATSPAEILDREESRSCEEQIQSQSLRSCKEYLTDGSRFESNGWREEFPRCCEDLEQINEQCRCQAIKKMGQEQQKEGGLEGREKREMLRTLQSLTSLCRISPRSCGGAPTTTFYSF